MCVTEKLKLRVTGEYYRVSDPSGHNRWDSVVSRHDDVGQAVRAATQRMAERMEAVAVQRGRSMRRSQIPAR